MSKAAKAKAQKLREHKRKMEEQENAALDRKMNKLRTLTGGFTLTSDLKVRVQSKEYVPPKINYRTSIERLPRSPDPVPQAKTRKVLTPEEELREQIAQHHIKQKQARVMPLYNKGGLMVATDSEMQASRQGELKRR